MLSTSGGGSIRSGDMVRGHQGERLANASGEGLHMAITDPKFFSPKTIHAEIDGHGLAAAGTTVRECAPVSSALQFSVARQLDA
ncbi:hypothetical protein J2Y55_003561 [Bosea sp. BE125]|uniref:hypothetical protein n=1 Tax=Bosea sp. BE125 TaxID=2817909 RepID=UPI002861265F|nr:hypothetical protein [Bosea sp. BE125]MDR6872545.1 hypothetical protein [Bosea sp. BE125]